MWSSEHHKCQHNSRSLWWWQAWWERSCLSSPHGIELLCLNEAGVSVLGVGKVFESSELEEPLACGFQHYAAQLGLALSVLGKSHPPILSFSVMLVLNIYVVRHVGREQHEQVGKLHR